MQKNKGMALYKVIYTVYGHVYGFVYDFMVSDKPLLVLKTILVC